MRRNKIGTLLIMGVLILSTLLGSFSFHLTPPVPTIDATSLGASTTSKADSDFALPSDDLLEAATVPTPPPEIRNYTIGTGSNRPVQVDWNLTQTFTDIADDDDFQISTEKGQMYRETAIFTRIGNIDDYNTYFMVENGNPYAALFYFEAVDRETLFMAFNISGNAPCLLEGFWVFLGPGTTKEFNYCVLTAQPNTTAGFGTEPNRTQKVYPSTTFSVPSIPLEGTWIWLDAMGPILDSRMTYASTFYLSLTPIGPAAKVHWVLFEDYFDPDQDDEGDAWFGSSGAPPTLTFLPYDFFLDVQITRQPYPYEIGMMVNGTPVNAIPYFPGVGYIDQFYSPAINMTAATRYYNVTFDPIWSGIEYDVTWQGAFYENILASAVFQTWADKLTVEWNLTLYFDYPTNAFDQSIFISVERNWTIVEVLHNGIPHVSWQRIYYAPSQTYWVKIENADDGLWIVRCSSPNHVIGVEVWNADDPMRTPTTEVNATDDVIVAGYLQSPSGVNVTTGQGFLDVYDPNEVLNHTGWNWVYDPPGGIVDFYWGIWWTVEEALVPGVYTIFVTWSNGTHAGMNFTTLIIHPMTRLDIIWEFPSPGEPVIRGELIEFLVIYRDHQWHGLNNSDVFVRNDSSMSEWDTWGFLNLKDYFSNESYAGMYWIWLETNNSQIDTIHNITLSLVEPLYVEQTYSKSFLVMTNPITIKFIVGSGVIFNHTEGMWRTSPDPYINQTGLQFTILLLDVSGTPIAHADLDPMLKWGSLRKHLIWIDLYEQRLGDLGYYNITIDMTPIEGITFHVGDTPFVQILAKKPGYEEAVSELIHIRPKPRPSYFEIQSQYQNILLWAGWNYSLPLRVVLRDGLSGEDVSHGTVTVFIPGAGNLFLQLATPGLGLYELPFLDTTNIPSDTHEVSVSATASDYIPCTDTVTITIQPKKTIGHTVIHWVPPVSYYGTLELELQFFFNDATSSQNKASKQDLSMLPEGTKVRLEAEGSVANPSVLGSTRYLDAEGLVMFEIEIDHDDYYSFFVTIEGGEDFEGLTNAMVESPPGQPFYIPIRHPFTDVYIRLPWIGLSFVGIAGAIVGYRQYVIIPKRRRRQAEYQAIADTFSDVANLNRLLVLHKESGICVFDPFTDETQDASLVAGFLQAISTFGHDLADSPGLTEGDKEEATTLRELTYEGFRILIHDGAFVRNALVLSGTPSDQIRERLEQFTEKFEERYKKEFRKWEGRVDQFSTAIDLVEDLFEVSLRHPHRVAPERPSGAPVTSLESDIYKLSKELIKDREYIFLGQLLSTYLTAAKRNKLEVLMAIYQLRQKKFFIPWHINASLSVTATPPQP